MSLRIICLSVFLVLSAAVGYATPLPIQPAVGFTLVLLSAGLLVYACTDQTQTASPKIKWACLALGGIGLALLLLFRLDAPWTDHRSSNGALWSLHARNIARFGFCATRGILYRNGGGVLETQAPIYNHHPPGLVWVLAVLFKLFGPHEWVARLVPVAFSLTGAWALLTLSLRRFGPAGSGCVLLAAAACPALTYIGRMVNFEPLVLAVSLTFYASLDRATGPLTINRLAVLMALATAPWMGWAGCVWAFIAAVLWSRAQRVRHPVFVWLIPLVSVIAILLFLSNEETRGFMGTIKRSMKWHYVSRPEDRLSLGQWLKTVGVFLNDLLPWPLWFLFPVIAWRRIRDALPWRLLTGTILPFALLLPIMPLAFLKHDYHVMSLWPFAALLSGVVAAGLPNRPRLRYIMPLILLVPLSLGMSTYKKMHQTFVPIAPSCLQERINTTHARVGERINAVTPPNAKIVVIPGKKGFTPALWYYMDRDFRVLYSLPTAFRMSDSWDYVLVLPNKRNPLKSLSSPVSLTLVFKDSSGILFFQKTKPPLP